MEEEAAPAANVEHSPDVNADREEEAEKRPRGRPRTPPKRSRGRPKGSKNKQKRQGSPGLLQTEREKQQAHREAYFARLRAEEQRVAEEYEAQMHRDEEEAERLEAQRQQAAREALLNSNYEQGEHFTHERHEAMYAAIQEGEGCVRKVPGGPNNLYYCLQRWAQAEGIDRLYGRTVEQLRMEASDRTLQRCTQRAWEEELTRRVGPIDAYTQRMRESLRVDRDTLEVMCDMVQGPIRVICPDGEEEMASWSYKGYDKNVDWEDEDLEPALTLVWVNDTGEGELNHLHVAYSAQTKGEQLTRFLGYPPYGNQTEHNRMWEQAGTGPPRHHLRGGLGLYQALATIPGTELTGRTSQEVANRVADEVDEQEREDRVCRGLEFDGDNSNIIRQRAGVHVEALLAIKELLQRPMRLHFLGLDPIEMKKVEDNSEDMVTVIWYHHGGRGYADSWKVYIPQETEMEDSEPDSEEETDPRDIPWGEKGAIGFWDWEERKRPIPKDPEFIMLDRILIPICSSEGDWMTGIIDHGGATRWCTRKCNSHKTC
mmetsp:Transcript_62390/g.129507  ORF Transcript_62390/g.129507 Transcript_62390/m.129507 type:complete len:542 (+) Transcript_62390:2207-3832(+)